MSVTEETKSSAVDTSVLFDAWAAHGPEGPFVPWQYHPRVLGEEDIEIAISHCGICGSDIHTAFSGWSGTIYPAVVGHEIVGTVVKRGPKSIWQIGDRVGVGAQSLSCLNREEKPCTSCASKQENYCYVNWIGTYNSRHHDGEVTRGGYAKSVRLNSNFAFKIPEALGSAEAAPLLCAGATVWAPLVHSKVGPGVRVGVIGIGGLGHLAVQFAAKLGATVTAIGTSPDKEPLARKLGASAFINSNDNAQVEAARRSLDVIISTANADDMPWDKYLSLVAYRGQFVLVALPNKNLSLSCWDLVKGNFSLKGSMIASIQEIRDMLEFAAQHGVRAITEEADMKDVNEAVKRVEKNQVRFRMVLKN